MVDLPRHFVEIQHHLNKMHKPLFECGNVPSLHLAMEAVGYVAVETHQPPTPVGMEIGGALIA